MPRSNEQGVRLTARLAAAGPHLTLEAVPLDSRHFETKLASGAADLALGADLTIAELLGW